MWLALTLGLTGSLGHCTGMCSGIVLLLQRSLGSRSNRSAWVQIHAGRLAAYSALGFVAGVLGESLHQVFDELQMAQGVVALYTALLGFYFVLVIAGWVPGPEALFPGLVTRWRKGFQKLSRPGIASPPLLLGLGWGLLPCGLTLTALLMTAVPAGPAGGALRMALFGFSTLPLLGSVRWLAARPWFRTWPRYGAAAALAVFSLQIGMRAMAAFGFVSHMMVGEVMLW